MVINLQFQSFQAKYGESIYVQNRMRNYLIRRFCYCRMASNRGYLFASPGKIISILIYLCLHKISTALTNHRLQVTYVYQGGAEKDFSIGVNLNVDKNIKVYLFISLSNQDFPKILIEKIWDNDNKVLQKELKTSLGQQSGSWGGSRNIGINNTIVYNKIIF